MATQFSMIDAPAAAQRLRVSWEMQTPRDNSGDRPDERDDGFWPSLNSDDCGYIGGRKPGETKAEYERRYKREFNRAQGRLSAWKADKWHYVGVVAVARVFVPVGGSSFHIIELSSAGLWGIESNAGKYLRDVYAEQKAELLATLQTFGAALQSGDYTSEESE